jgi:hypothetical protein
MEVHLVHGVPLFEWQKYLNPFGQIALKSLIFSTIMFVIVRALVTPFWIYQKGNQLATKWPDKSGLKRSEKEQKKCVIP